MTVKTPSRVSAKFEGECSVSSGTYPPGQTINAECRVKNTSDAAADFVVVLRAVAPNGKEYSNTSLYSRITPGKIETFGGSRNLSVRIPSDALEGNYDVRLEIRGWGTDDSGKIFDTKFYKAKFTIKKKKAANQITFIATCPVDIEVTDPDGLVVNKQSSQIPEATYTEKV